METEQLKNELYKLPIETIESLFAEVLERKKESEQERRIYNASIETLHKLLFELLTDLRKNADLLKKRLLLFDYIGCSIGGKGISTFVIDVIDNMTVAQLLNINSIAYLKKKG